MNAVCGVKVAEQQECTVCVMTCEHEFLCLLV